MLKKLCFKNSKKFVSKTFQKLYKG